MRPTNYNAKTNPSINAKSATQNGTLPPLLTRGVTPPVPSTKANSYQLDWLQYSVRWPHGLQSWPHNSQQEGAILLTCLPRHSAIQFTGEKLHPIRGYAEGMQLTYGRVFYHPARPEQKIGVVLSGQDLSAIGLDDIPHENLLYFALDISDKITRIDFALDVFDETADPQRMYDAWKDGKVETGARSVRPFTEATKDPEGNVTECKTIYFGSRDSDRMVRIYDKGKQSGSGFGWTRIEISVKDDRARALAEDMRRYGIKNAGIAAIREFIRCSSVYWWKNALAGQFEALTPVPRKATNTEKWLLEQCLPVMRRMIEAQAERGEWEIFDAYHGTLQSFLFERNKVRKS